MGGTNSCSTPWIQLALRSLTEDIAVSRDVDGTASTYHIKADAALAITAEVSLTGNSSRSTGTTLLWVIYATTVSSSPNYFPKLPQISAKFPQSSPNSPKFSKFPPGGFVSSPI